MAWTILLYGATGYSGRLIADELARTCGEAPGSYRVVLAGRDGERVGKLARERDLDFTAFALDDTEQAGRALAASGADVVINAAGPFAWTAPCLASAAIDQGCHYVDINGEADVYDLLYDRVAIRAGRSALVGGAGFWAAASNLLLDRALDALSAAPHEELGAIRIAMSRIRTFTRGSAATVWRSLRQQVTVVRKGVVGSGAGKETLVRWHEPAGRLERSFDFGWPERDAPRRRIASASSLVDTLAARLTVLRRGLLVDTIESYVEADEPARMAYQLGASLAPLLALPAVRTLAQQPLTLMAEGPTALERRDEPHTIVLEIEDRFRSVVIDWRWVTPNVYQFTAQLAVAVATQLRANAPKGWLTPAEALAALPLEPDVHSGPLRDCHLQRRRG